jgi:LacI family transcriptional regulator
MRPLNSSRPATLRLIAEQTGVSITTVSRILSDKRLHSFSEETIELVRSAAAKLRYRPNHLVHSLQSGRSGFIGVVMPAFGSYYGSVLAGIHDTLIEQNNVPIVLWTKTDSPWAVGKNELEQIHTLVDRRVDGIILKPIFDAASDEYLTEIFDRNIPLVVVDRELPKVPCNFVGTDDFVGVESAVEHLTQLGHRRIAYFGPQTQVSTGQRRLSAFRTIVRQNPEIEASEHLTESWTADTQDAIALLKRSPRPTGIVAVSDDFAWLLYQAAAALGLAIPRDVSIIGFGDLPKFSVLQPRLTSLDQHAYTVGERAAGLLLSCIQQKPQRPSKLLITPELKPRGSTSSPPPA